MTGKEAISVHKLFEISVWETEPECTSRLQNTNYIKKTNWDSWRRDFSVRERWIHEYRDGFRHVRGVPPHWGLHQIMEFRDLHQPKKYFNNYLLQPWAQA